MPWKKCADLGHLTAICSGDLTNEGRSSLVAVAADGWCYVFDLTTNSTDSKKTEKSDSEEKEKEKCDEGMMRPIMR